MSLQSSSSFRRSGQRDERRRRLLTEELANPGDWSSGQIGVGNAPPQKSEHYGDARFLEEQPRLLDLVPRRMVILVLLLAATALMPVGFIAAYVWMLDRVAGGGRAVAALDLAVKGSLGCWFSSLMLLVAAMAAILVYSVRRYRTDDYQGRYRIWLWVAAFWFLVATDQAASLREGFRDLMIGLTGTPLVANGNLWWVILYTLGLGAVGSRLLVDMRSNPLAVSILIGGVLMHALATAVRLGWILPLIGSNAVMFFSGAEMAGNLMLMAAMILHARYVILDAEGLLPRRTLDIEDQGEAEETANRSYTIRNRWRKIDPPHAAPQPVFQQAPMLQPAASPTSATVSSPVHRKLTKGERKALKERLLRERMERERRNK